MYPIVLFEWKAEAKKQSLGNVNLTTQACLNLMKALIAFKADHDHSVFGFV